MVRFGLELGAVLLAMWGTAIAVGLVLAAIVLLGTKVDSLMKRAKS
jgi:hypothetical protein